MFVCLPRAKEGTIFNKYTNKVFTNYFLTLKVISAAVVLVVLFLCYEILFLSSILLPQGEPVHYVIFRHWD